MALPAEEILLRVSLNTQEAKKQVVDLTKTLQAAKKAQDENNKAFNAGKISADEYAAATAANNAVQKAAARELAIVNKALADSEKANKAAAGSVDELKAKLSIATKAYNSLSASERDGSKAGQELKARTKELADELRRLGADVSDHRRNVGNYADALGTAGQASELLGVNTQQLQSGFARAKQGVELAKTSFGTLRTAMLAVPIFAIVAAIAALVSYLTRTQAGADKLARVMGGLGRIVDKVAQTVFAFGEQATAAFENPQKAVEDLFKFLGENLLNRVKAFGILWDAIRTGDFKKGIDGVAQFTFGVTNATAKAKGLVSELTAAGAAGADIVTVTQRLRDEEQKLTVERSKSRAEVEKLKLLADDVTKSTAERTAAAQKAGEVERGQLEKALDLQRRRIANIEREIGLDKGRKATSEEINRLTEERAKLGELEAESTTRQIELQNKLNGLKVADRDKAIAATALALNNRKALIELELKQVADGGEQELTLLRERLDIERKLELNVKDLTEKQKAAIGAKYQAQALQQEQEFAVKRLRLDLQAGADRLAAAALQEQEGTDYALELAQNRVLQEAAVERAGLEARNDNRAKQALIDANENKKLADVEFTDSLKRLEEYLDDKRRAIVAANARGETTERQYQAQLAAFDQVALNARKSVYEDYGRDVKAINREIADAQVSDQKRVTEQQAQVLQQQVAAIEGFAQSAATLVADTLTQTGQDFQTFTGKVLILIIDALEKQLLATEAAAIAQATANSLSTYQSAVTGGALGITQGLILSGLIAAAFETAKGLISASLTTDKQFARGGTLGELLQGPSHAGGGVKLYGRNGAYYGEAEGGEAVINKRSTAQYLPLLSAINVAGGGKPLAPGGFMADGALTRAAVSGSSGIDYAAMERGFARAVEQLQIVVAVRDINAGQAKAAKVTQRVG